MGIVTSGEYTIINLYDGTSPYVHIAWADNSTGTIGFSTSTSKDKAYIGIYSDLSIDQSMDPELYNWSRIRGNSTYTWVKYADTPTSGMSDDPTNKKYIGLAFNKTAPTESTNYGDYQWSLLPQNIDISGRNLLMDTYNFSKLDDRGLANAVVVSNGGGSFTMATLPNVNAGLMIPFYETLQIDEVYTLSFEVESDVATALNYFRLRKDGWWDKVGTNRQPIPSILIQEGPNRISVRFTATHETNALWVALNQSVETELTFSKMMLEKGDTPTAWTPAFEDLYMEVADKVSSEALGEVSSRIGDIESYMEHMIPKADFDTIIGEFGDHLAEIDEDKAAILDAIQDISDRAIGLEMDFGDKRALLNFLTSSISFSYEGMLLSDPTGTVGIFIGQVPDDEDPEKSKYVINFIDGDEVIAYISGQVLYINHGIFVDSATIGIHKITYIDDEVTVFDYVGGGS